MQINPLGALGLDDGGTCDIVWPMGLKETEGAVCPNGSQGDWRSYLSRQVKKS